MMETNTKIEEVVETATDNKSGFKVAAGVGLVVVGVIAYKYVIKPIVAKIKQKKQTIEVIEEVIEEDE